MSSADLLSLLEQLDDDIDDLEDAIAPFVAQSLADAGPKLPLLDKAKLYVLVTYAIESMLFSYLRLQGVNAREHPVFQELTRVKQYFDKIKAAEAPADKADNKQVLNTAAAARFIKAGLAGNDKIDLARAEQLARERVRAQLASRKRSDNQAADPIVKQVAPLDVVDPTSSSGSDSHDDESPQETPIEQPGQGKKRKHNEVVAPEIENKAESSVVVNSPSTSKSMKEQDKPKKKRSKKSREKKKAKKGND